MSINKNRVALLNRSSQLSSIGLIGLGLTAMLGWILHIQLFSLLQPDHPDMKFNTALCITLIGLSINGIHRLTSPHRHFIARLGAALAVAIGVTTLVEIVLHLNFGLDELIINDPNSNGRMTAPAALAFVISGLSLLWLTRQPVSRSLVQAINLLMFLTSAITLIGALLHVQSGTTSFNNINVPTVIGTLLIGFATVTYQLDQGRLRMLVSETTGGRIMRWLSVGIVAVVILSGWITENIIPLGQTGLDHAVQYSLLIIVALLLVWWLSSRVNRAEAERNAALADLQEQRHLYHTLFESIDDAITLHDLDGKILEVNEAAVRRLGYSRDELLRMHTIDLDEPEYGAHFKDRVAKQTTEGSLNDIIGTHVAKDGHRIPIHVNSRVMTYKGEPAVLAVVRDISALRQAERDSVALELERERSRILTQFIRDASHEFRTPLTILATSLELFSRIKDETKRAAYINRSHDQIVLITKLISQLVLIAELDNRQEFDLRAVCVVGLFDRLKAQVSKTSPGREVVFEISPHLPATFIADGHKLQTALLELLDNALRYSPDSSRVTVRACSSHAYITFEVSDHGIGIEPNLQRLIFNRFFRHDIAHTTPGFGLGLPIAKLVAEGHRGRLEMESQSHVGSTFRMVLPLQEVKVSSVAETPSEIAC